MKQDVFIHPQALVESDVKIGKGTRIWAFAHVLPGAAIGEECNICDHTFIEGQAVIGNRVTIKCGVYLWDGVIVEDDVFVGPSVSFTNDKFPRSKQWPASYAKTTIKRGASLGANATILPVIVGEYAMVAAGAVVTRDVPSYAIVMGNPARIVGYVGAEIHNNQGLSSVPPIATNTPKTAARLLPISGAVDMRGDLSVIDWNKGDGFPFEVRRIFYTYHVPSHEVRGEHAHKVCHQLLICVAGSLQVIADDGHHREVFVLDSPKIGLYLPPLTWGIQYKHSADCVLLVLASHAYDPSDYIRVYSDFVAEVNKTL